MYKKDQKVVCIDDKIKVSMEIHNKHFSKWIEEDKVYTIRACTETPMGWGVLLKEVKNPAVFIQDYYGSTEPRFAATRFSPLLENEVDNFVKEVIAKVTEKEEHEVGV